jgi:hypothetical protein
MALVEQSLHEKHKATQASLNANVLQRRGHPNVVDQASDGSSSAQGPIGVVITKKGIKQNSLTEIQLQEVLDKNIRQFSAELKRLDKDIALVHKCKADSEKTMAAREMKVLRHLKFSTATSLSDEEHKASPEYMRERAVCPLPMVSTPVQGIEIKHDMQNFSLSAVPSLADFIDRHPGDVLWLPPRGSQRPSGSTSLSRGEGLATC